MKLPRVGVFSLGAIFGAVVASVFAFLAGFYLRHPTPPPPNLDDRNKWTLIKAFWGTLDPQEGDVTARVYSFAALSGPRGDAILQNRIEVTQGARSAAFTWPDEQAFAFPWCEIQDVDNDGRNEFLLFAGTQLIRIVSYSQGQFTFRPHADGIFSSRHDIGPFDFDQDGTYEFIDGDIFPENWAEEGKGVPLPRIKHWSKAEGFRDVSRDFPRYYVDTVIPELERKLSTETNPEMRRLYSEALAYVSKELLRSAKSVGSKASKP